MAVVVAALFLSSIAFARPGDGRPDNSELKKQLQEYRDKEIKPYLAEQKALLDSKLDKQSLEELNKLRAEANSLKKDGNNARSLMREARKSNDDKQIDAAKAYAKKHAAEFQSVAEKLKPIIKKNPKLVKEIAGKLKEKSKTWKEEIRKITDSWKEANKDKIKDQKNMMRKNNADKQNGKLRRDPKKMDSMKGKRAMARFMLWDGVSAIGPIE